MKPKAPQKSFPGPTKPSPHEPTVVAAPSALLLRLRDVLDELSGTTMMTQPATVVPQSLPDASKPLNYKEAAHVLGVPVGTLYSWVHGKKIPHLRLSTRLVRFDKSEIEQWLRSRKVTTSAEAVLA